jgi:hypothetical protein
MTVSPSGEENNPASLNGEGADRVTASAPAAEPETNEADVMVCYPEYWIG